jgi:hypothetical protein
VERQRNALLLVAVKTARPPMGSLTLPAARLYLLDENNKIKAEQVIFYAPCPTKGRRSV